MVSERSKQSKDYAQALLERVRESLAKPRPDEGSWWTDTPLDEIRREIGLPAPVSEPANPAPDQSQLLDTIARGVGLALADLAAACEARFKAIEGRLNELEQAQSKEKSHD